MIKTIVLSMESEPIYELLEPGDVLILYKEKNSYVYAVNKDGGLTIERVFVPPTQVKRAKESTDEKADKIVNNFMRDLGDKCKDCTKESSVWPGYVTVGTFKNCTP